MRPLFAISFILLVGCSEPEVPPAELDLRPLIARAESTYSDAALAYLRAGFDSLATHHVYGEAFDWEELWLATLESAVRSAPPRT